MVLTALDSDTVSFFESLMEEFRTAFVASRKPPEIRLTDAHIMVLSGEGGDNLARIKRGILAMNEKRRTLVLNGATEQLQPMREIALSEGLTDDHIVPIDCGPRAKANTKTQFEVLWAYGFKNVVLVTSAYHVPRVARQAAQFLPHDFQYQVDGAEGDETVDRVHGEISRIIQYAKKGDIALHRRGEAVVV